eukprot:TRINITY_DN19585_c0_g1_i1.p1 TRINITY_DN19585_c0_g1~~TRINITY_DN19585_c0_g1_i1.p1  ORF type:complete len:307 (-),score=33.72 TRINITY_DN19585_c0_g1_i1:114-965(-)
MVVALRFAMAGMLLSVAESSRTVAPQSIKATPWTAGLPSKAQVWEAGMQVFDFLSVPFGPPAHEGRGPGHPAATKPPPSNGSIPLPGLATQPTETTCGHTCLWNMLQWCHQVTKSPQEMPWESLLHFNKFIADKRGDKVPANFGFPPEHLSQFLRGMGISHYYKAKDHDYRTALKRLGVEYIEKDGFAHHSGVMVQFWLVQKPGMGRNAHWVFVLRHSQIERSFIYDPYTGTPRTPLVPVNLKTFMQYGYSRDAYGNVKILEVITSLCPGVQRVPRNESRQKK